MIIKKFQEKTEEEAVENAKKELGNNVVIMNVKNIKRKGIFRLFRKQLIEVTVALEDESERYPETLKETAEKRAQPAIQAIAKESAIQKEIEEENLSGTMLEERLESLQSLLEKQLGRSEDEKAPEEDEAVSETVVFMQLLYNTMIENEVKEKYANQIIDDVEKNNKPNMPIDYILANIYQKMILKFGKASVITPAKEGPKVIFFIGPTGVGKTTTIAKIASKFKVEEQKRIALLTADTYRIAAAEQLRTYANILDVPFRVVYSAGEAQNALKEFKNFDYVLIDTAGHSHQNEVQKESMNELIHCLPQEIEREVFLVLSATTKYRDLANIADSYSKMTDYKLIFTKLDETTSLGNLLNLKLHTGVSLSYVTCGQNVPDDIEYFNPQKTVKLLLGGKKG